MPRFASNNAIYEIGIFNMNKFLSFITSIPFLVMASLATTVTSIDIYMPCLPQMADYFQCSAYKMQLSIGLGVLGTSVATPFLGPLSDSIGRRKLFVFGHIIYSICIIATGFAQTVDQLIVLRFVSGLFLACINVISFAIIADSFKGSKVAIYFAYCTTTITTSLVVAPLVGGFIADHYEWYVCFFALGAFSACVSVLLFFNLPETLAKTHKFSLKKTITTYKNILESRSFVAMALIPSIMIAGLLTFLSCASFYYIKEINVSAGEFSLHQAFLMVCNSMFSYIAGRSIEKMGLKGIIKLGMVIFSIGGFGFLFASIFTPGISYILTITISLFASGIGFVFASISAEAMGLFPENAGATSSMITFIRGIIITFFVSMAGAIYNGGIFSLAALITTITILILGIYWILHRESVRA